MKKKTFRQESSIPLFRDKDVDPVNPISIKDIDKHLRKLKKINKWYDELLRDLPDIPEF